jgi:hypothetical protein
MGFWSASTVGGSVSQIYESATSYPDAPSLAGLDEENLYYTYYSASNSESTGIFAMPKRGGDTRVVVPNTVPTLINSRTIDDTHVYWVDVSDQYNIRRAPKNGNGAFESIPVGSFSTPEDLIVDGCAIYWTSGAPNQLLVRAK